MILGYQGYSGNIALGTPPGGGTFPAPGREYSNSGFQLTIEDSDDSPAGGRATYGQGGVPAGPGTGPGWNGTLQALALAGGTALISRILGPRSDSRSTKPSSVPPTPTSSGAAPLPGFDNSSPRVIDENKDGLGFPSPAPAGGFNPSPLLLAAAAAVALLVFVRR